MDAYQRLALERFGHFLREQVAVNCQRVTSRNLRGARDFQEQRSRAPHLFFEHPGRSVLAVGLERIRTNQFGKMRRLVGGRVAHRAHLVEIDSEAATRALPGGFRSGQSGADDFDRV